MTDAELTIIYNDANCLDPTRHNPISSNRIFTAMRAAISAEREACAKVCEEFDYNNREQIDAPRTLPRYCAAAIRSRSNTP